MPFFLVLVGLINPPTASAVVDGMIDTSFGTSGSVVSDFGSNAVILDSVVQPNGKIILAGYATNGMHDFFVARYNSDGSLDTSFDGDGKTTTDFGTSNDEASAVILQPDGKIVAGGAASISSKYNFALARYNSDGSLDTSFDGDGKVLTNIQNYSDVINDLVLLSDGKLVATGYSMNPQASWTEDLALARYNSDGSLDASFDGDGVVVTTTTTAESGKSIGVQPDGKILVSGTAEVSGVGNFLTMRFNANGSLDTSFDTDGMVTTSFGTSALVSAQMIQPDGKVLVGGQRASGLTSIAVLARYNSDGSLDTSFDGDGKLDSLFANNLQWVSDLEVQNDGKIVFIGDGGVSENSVFAVRLNTNGSLDTSLNQTGVTPAMPVVQDAISLHLLSEGKLIITGREFGQYYKPVLVKAQWPSVIPPTSTTATTATTTTTQPSTATPSGGSVIVMPSPSQLSYVAANKKISLLWLPVAGATSYVAVNSSGQVKCASIAATCSISGLTNGKANTFVVYSVDSVGVRSTSGVSISALAGFQVKSTSVKLKKSIPLSSVVGSPSKGKKTWVITSGSCRIKNGQLIAQAKVGSCGVKLLIGKSGSYASMATSVKVTVTQ